MRFLSALLLCALSLPLQAQENVVKGQQFSLRIHVEKGEGDIFATVKVKNLLEFGVTTGLEVFQLDGTPIMVEIEAQQGTIPDRVRVVPIYGYVIEPDILTLEENEQGQIVIRYIPLG